MSEKTICNLTFAEIKELAELVSDKKLGKIEIKLQDSSITIADRKCSAMPVVPPMPPVMMPAEHMPAAEPAPVQKTVPAEEAAPVEAAAPAEEAPVEEAPAEAPADAE